MRLKLLSATLIVVTVSFPALTLAQDPYYVPPVTGYKCFNATTGAPVPCNGPVQQPNPQGLDCRRGTHQEGDTCVPNVLDKSGHVVTPAPQSNKNQVPPAKTSNQGWWNRALARGKPGGSFRNDIFDPLWYFSVFATFTSDIFNPIWQTQVASHFRDDLFNRGWWWVNYQKSEFKYPTPTPISTSTPHTKKK